MDFFDFDDDWDKAGDDGLTLAFFGFEDEGCASSVLKCQSLNWSTDTVFDLFLNKLKPLNYFKIKKKLFIKKELFLSVIII